MLHYQSLVGIAHVYLGQLLSFVVMLLHTYITAKSYIFRQKLQTLLFFCPIL